ncbi:MAG: hypothetical protein ACI94Y_003235 [Maribacter sp.]|jgi:hypothetical protein
MKIYLKQCILVQIIFICFSSAYSQQLVVSTESIQIVYQNIDNPINTNIECFAASKILYSDNGVINIKGDKIYWKPKGRGISFLKLIEISEGDTITLDSSSFYVKGCPFPRINLNIKARHSGIGSYYSQKLIFEFENRYKHLKIEEKIRILSFDMTVILKDKNDKIERYLFHSKNEFLPDEFKNIREQLKNGNLLIVKFSKVEIECDWQKEAKYYDEYFELIPGMELKWTWLIE